MTTSEYSAKDIHVLEGLEPVRKRPGMYIGGTDKKALHHLISEVLDNAIDEVIAGYGKTIEVHFKRDGHIAIYDDGRGIPTDEHPQFPAKSALEIIFTTLHSGGKFKKGAYQISGGLHGVGLSVVSALCDHAHVQVFRGKDIWEQTYSKGIPLTPLLHTQGEKNKRGTCVTFHPDPEIFEDPFFDPSLVYEKVQAKAYLFKVKIIWVCEVKSENVPKKEIIFYPQGLVSYLKSRIEIEDAEVFSGSLTFLETHRIDWSVCFDIQEDHFFESYCNGIPTPLGGTHESAFKTGLIRGFRSYAELVHHKKMHLITPDDVFKTLKGIISCFVEEPQFQGQTKEKLMLASIAKPVENGVCSHVLHFLTQHPPLADRLIELFLSYAQMRLSKKEDSNASLKALAKRMRLPGKLTDCTNKNLQEREIFFVEGDSAGGSAKQARNRDSQAVMPLKGKILNVLSATDEKMQNNKEVKDLILALGCANGKNFDIAKLRYGKIIIMTDADVDGAHIASLLLTFFYKEMPQLLEEGHVYLAAPPLYRLSTKDKVVYAMDETQKNVHLSTTFKRTSNVEISRFKGLGEMSAKQLKETTMDPNKRILYRVQIGEHSGEVVLKLMGKNPSYRFDMIKENAAFTSVDI